MNTSDHVTFSTFEHAGDTRIATIRHREADASATPHIMFCGGFHSAMLGTKASACIAQCQRNNWHCTLFDYRGHGQSDGKPEQFTLADWLEDTLAVLDEQQLPCVLVGSSMGAWLATLAALQRPQLVSGLLLLASAPDFLQELVTPKLTPSNIWDLQQGLPVNLSNDDDNPYPVTQALLDSGTSLSLFTGNALEALHCPLRLVHGTLDTDVPYDFSTRLLDGLPAGHDARLTLLHGADHRLSDAASLSYTQDELDRLVQQISHVTPGIAS